MSRLSDACESSFSLHLAAMRLSDFKSEKVSTDILIIGGGLAAMAAALEAAEFGCSPVLACKAKVGGSGATLMAGANLAAVMTRDDADDNDEQSHFEDTYTEGLRINDTRLVRTLTEHAPNDILFLEELGVRFLKRNGRFELSRPPGHRHPRTTFTLNDTVPLKIRGKTITAPLRQQIARKGIKTLDGVHIFKLMVNDGNATGALGFHLKSSTIIHFESSAVILASGGGGSIYARNTNPSDLTGDSYALALEAGCKLRDMEFVQFFPCMHRSLPRLIIYSPTLSCGGVLRDKDGDRFMNNYDPERMETANRDVVSQAIYREILENRGIDGAVYLDLTGISREIFDFRFPDLLKAFKKYGIDLKTEWIKVSPAAHFFMGGCMIDEHCRTSIAGLFAAGEATGGLHGANRLSGNGLSEALVFGRIAGKTAGDFARDKSKKISSKAIRSPFASRGQTHSEDFMLGMRRKIKRLNWEKVGIVRDISGLNEAIEELKQMKGYFENGRPDSPTGLKLFLEVRSMLTTSLAVALAAAVRTESRGAHFRKDFPKTNAEMEKSISISMERNDLAAAFL